jgi:hypothetical protein
MACKKPTPRQPGVYARENSGRQPARVDVHDSVHSGRGLAASLPRFLAEFKAA